MKQPRMPSLTLYPDQNHGTDSFTSRGTSNPSPVALGPPPNKRGRKVLSRMAFGAVATMMLCSLPNFAAVSMAASKPLSLQSLGKPKITASCNGGSYHVASAATPITTISGKKWTTGFALWGTNCDTRFTWSVGNSFSEFRATVTLDMSGSGPVAVAFQSGSTPLKFTAGNRSVSTFVVGQGSTQLKVPVRGVRQLSVVLPNRGSDAGIVVVTSNTLS